MVEIHRRLIFLVNLQAERGKVLLNMLHQRLANPAADRVRRDKQRAQKARFHHAGKAFQ